MEVISVVQFTEEDIDKGMRFDGKYIKYFLIPVTRKKTFWKSPLWEDIQKGIFLLMDTFNAAETLTAVRYDIGQVHRLAGVIEHKDPGECAELEAEMKKHLHKIATILRPLTAIQLAKVMKEWGFDTTCHSTSGVVWTTLMLDEGEYIQEQEKLALEAQLYNLQRQAWTLEHMVMKGAQENMREIQKKLSSLTDKAKPGVSGTDKATTSATSPKTPTATTTAPTGATTP
jgi:hypothetical protein